MQPSENRANPAAPGSGAISLRFYAKRPERAVPEPHRYMALPRIRPFARLVVLLTFFAATFVQALPPAPPKLATLTSKSDLIAIVHVAEPVQKPFGKRSNRVLLQRADATVERVLKGAPAEKVVLTFEDNLGFLCRPSRLYKGRFLLFLKKDGDAYVRSDNWYSQAEITNKEVRWLLGAPSDVSTVIAEIQRIVEKK